ncbi:MAG: Ribonuclease 3 [Candidatus Nomurabacteria bacterium GW2011_GWC2_36_9]|nr:MAG: Ribonuclease 3 [Candidatus Nomurabacteria bacterium GW2011_GWC2_36_9]
MIDFSQFEKKTKIVFKDKKLLEQAFIHRSYINENSGGKLCHNERLEFLGDASR